MLNRLTKLSIIAIMFFGVYNYSDASFTISRPSTNNIGLVGHWTMDGKNVVNGVAMDSSGNGNNANLINIATSTFYSIGKIGQGFNFDGTNDIASTTRINNNEITVAGWFYKNANDFGSNNADALFGAWRWNSNTQLQEGFVLRPGHLVSQNCTGVATGSAYLCSAWMVVTTNGATKTQKTSVFNLSSISKNGTTTQEWFHIAGTYNSTDGNQRLYVNGVLRDTGLHVAGNTVVPLATTTAGACYLYMKIGYDCENTGYFNGRIDDVRLYNRALSANEVKSLYNQGLSKFNKSPTKTLISGLVGYWTMDGGDTNWTTNTITDKSTSGNTGTMTNMSTSTSPAIGKIGQALSFDGVDDYVPIPPGGAPLTGSISFWYKFNTAARTETEIWYGNSWYAQEMVLFRRYNTDDKIHFGIYTGGVNQNDVSNFTTSVMSPNVWYHIAATFQTNDVRLYFNGTLQQTDTVASMATTTGTEVRLGRGSGGGASEYMQGGLDEVRFYNRILSANEVKTLYNMGR